MRGMGLKELVISVALGACVASTHRGTPVPSGTADEEASKILEQNMSGPRMRGLAGCPSAVAGATTSVTKIPEGVDLVITAPDKDRAAQIRILAHRLAELQPASEVVQHTGKGTGGGKIGYCPVVIVDTELTVEDVEGGSRILAKARHPAFVSALQAITEERAEALETAQK